MPSITDASEPSLSIELTGGTSLYYTVSKRRRGRRREKGENEIRREGEGEGEGRCAPGLLRQSPFYGASALRERWRRTQGS